MTRSWSSMSCDGENFSKTFSWSNVNSSLPKFFFHESLVQFLKESEVPIYKLRRENKNCDFIVHENFLCCFIHNLVDEINSLIHSARVILKGFSQIFESFWKGYTNKKPKLYRTRLSRHIQINLHKFSNNLAEKSLWQSSSLYRFDKNICSENKTYHSY